MNGLCILQSSQRSGKIVDIYRLGSLAVSEWIHIYASTRGLIVMKLDNFIQWCSQHIGFRQMIEEDVTDKSGESPERVSPDSPNWGFYAHLSIYTFAVPFAVGRNGLDAGCGTGYGTSYLVEHGARYVVGVDHSSKAIKYCRARYSRDNLRFQMLDLNQKLLFEDAFFDVIFTSNTMEHLTDVDEFLEETTRILAKEGVLIAAVPPVVTSGMLKANLANPYHINNLTPRGWFTKLGRFFEIVQGYRHWVKREWMGEDGMPRDMTLSAEETEIRETDFTFEEMPIEQLNSLTHNITEIFVAKKPRTNPLPPTPKEKELPEMLSVNVITCIEADS
jgi:SAM-dependent methyltransferase